MQPLAIRPRAKGGVGRTDSGPREVKVRKVLVISRVETRKRQRGSGPQQLYEASVVVLLGAQSATGQGEEEVEQNIVKTEPDYRWIDIVHDHIAYRADFLETVLDNQGYGVRGGCPSLEVWESWTCWLDLGAIWEIATGKKTVLERRRTLI